MNKGIFLLLGSNQEQPVENLGRASEEIEKDAGKILSRSSVYKSAAWGIEDQPDFYNQVLEIDSPYFPEQLLEKLLDIEKGMGRIRLRKWGPRLIDIDLLFYGQQVISTSALKVPHPGIPERRFTLLPLAEIAAEFVHPVSGKTIATLLSECKDLLRVEKVNGEW